MPTEPRRPDPAHEVLFSAPAEPPAPVRLSIEDILDHLRAGARDQLARRPASSARAVGEEAVEPDEQSRRLENVARLVDELRTELAALAALRPPDIG